MNLRRLLLPLAGLAMASPALAGDSRLMTLPYNADEVVRVDGRAGIQATIAFGDDEQIENVAVGDSGSWQITPNKRADALFVKPLAANARTNMTVLTDKRTYFFDLVASPSARPVYMLRFAHKDQKPATAIAASGAGTPPLTEAESAALAGAAPSGLAPVDPASLNFAWRRKGDERLQPARVYDDGQSTYLQLADRQTMPAILIRNEKGEEGPVNFAVRDDTIVIDAVPGLIVLRQGKAMALLENTRPAQPRTLPAAPPSLPMPNDAPAVAIAAPPSPEGKP